MTPTSRRQFIGGIRIQLLLPAIALLVVTLALIVVVALDLTRRQIRQIAEEQVRQRTSSAAAIWAAASPDSRTARLRHWMLDSDTRTIVVTDGDGAPHLTLDAATADPLYDLPAQPDEDPFLIDLPDGTSLMVSQARTSTGDVIYAGVALSTYQRRLDVSRNLLWLYVALDAVFLLILGYALFTFAVIRPLRAIQVATDRAAQGDLASPITRTPNNEFGVVAHSFNAMLERLDAQREDLEAKIEELEQANEDLQRAQDSLIRSEKLASVGQLAAGIAHEVGNPLTAVHGWAEVLADGDLDDETVRTVGERVLAQVGRMRTIIRELLDFSRDDADHPLTPIDLHACVAEALRLASATKRTRHITMEMDDAALESAPHPRAVHSQVVQILINLIFNAADALRDAEVEVEDPTVTVSAHTTEDHCILSVTDNGPGVSLEAAPRLFDPFFTTKPVGEGTGLGLAICLRIMQRFDGDLRVVPHEDGARFELVFPRGGDTTIDVPLSTS